MKSIIISRTDNIGDVVLTLPMAGTIKTKYPDCKIYFVGKKYTQPIIESCTFVDQFIDREEAIASEIFGELGAEAIVHVFPDKQIAKAAYLAKVPLRIGTSHRWFHWLYCNKLISFSRRNSSLHESVLNFKLLAPFHIDLPHPDLIHHWYGIDEVELLETNYSQLIQTGKKNIILHPKSKGSAREWPLSHYSDLIELLPADNYHFFITGTLPEGELIRQRLLASDFINVTDLTGKLSLSQLLSVIKESTGLVACSTGPLHLAAALGKYAIGIYPPMKPIHSGRWGALGRHAKNLSIEKNCADCRKSTRCHCIEMITPENVAQELLNLK